MIQKIVSLFKLDKDREDKWRKSITGVGKSIQDYFFLRGIDFEKVWILTVGAIVCSAILFVGTSAVRVDAVSSLPVGKGNLIEAYVVYYRGDNIGIIENKTQADAILESIRKDFQDQYDMEAMLNEDVKLAEVLTESCFLSNMSDIKKSIATSIDIRVKSAVLQINGEDAAVLKDEETVNNILKRFKEPYQKTALQKGNNLKNITFEENIEIKPSYVDYSMIQDQESVYKELMGETRGKKTYEIQEGDTLWDIARNNKMTVEDIYSANPSMMDSDILKIGTELNLVVPEKKLNVITVEEIRYTEEVPFETETEKSSSMYSNQTKVKQEGQNGEQEVVAQVKKYNGIEKERQIISQTVTKEPVKKIVMKGTKTPPSMIVASRGSGHFIWPTRGSISSRFGTRWGRLHAGVDIANTKGTPIYAVDSGTVTYSAYNSGGYGNLVKINHGSGIQTCYGHMSSRTVSSGQKVKKGQLIGYMGSTGRSSGSHLHFEVRVNGSAVDPLKYLD